MESLDCVCCVGCGEGCAVGSRFKVRFEDGDLGKECADALSDIADVVYVEVELVGVDACARGGDDHPGEEVVAHAAPPMMCALRSVAHAPRA